MPKPYYEHSGITIYHGDCREILPTLALSDGAALVCDPPYGTEEFNGGYGRAHVTIANDSDVAAFAGMLSVWHVAPSWCLAFCDTRKRREAEDALLASGFSLVGEAVWDKGMPSLGYTVRYAHESVIVARRGGIKPESPLISVLRGRRTMREIAGRHPHEKPDEVMGRLIEFCVPPDGVAVDPFMGSGSTLVAAKNLGRRAIGIEIEEKYCAIAAQRLSQEVLDFGRARG